MLKTGNVPGIVPGAFFMVSQKKQFQCTSPMYEQFIELTDQLYWEGYAEQLAQENPERFSFELSDFMNNYQY